MYFLSNQWSGKNFNCMVLKLLENAFASQNIESRHFHQWFPPYKTSILIVLPITMLIQFFTSFNSAGDHFKNNSNSQEKLNSW